MRFVIVCLIFLGLAFYQMSGGSDFVPRSVERQAMADAAPKPAAVAAERPKPARAAPVPAAVPVRIARPATPTAPSPDDSDAARAQRDRPALADAPVSIFARPSGPVEGHDITLVSLEDNPRFFAQPLDAPAGDGTPAATADIVVAPSLGAALSSPLREEPVAEPDPITAATEVARPDIRRVKGSAVNLRGGPGTTFAILATLIRDTEVEVLEDPGDGWVHLRPLSGGPTGWMADYLLTN